MDDSRRSIMDEFDVDYAALTSKEKTDMSDTCDFDYFMYELQAHLGRLSQEEWEEWYKEHCGKCVFMGDICMYGELMRGVLNEMS